MAEQDAQPGSPVEHGFDKPYWDEHWQRAHGATPVPRTATAPHPYLAQQVGPLRPGTALDAGCGEGSEALWLAAHGWQVTAVDIAATAFAGAADRADDNRGAGHVEWFEADLTDWEPGTTFDLVTTHYAHPAMPQLAFYERISAWVAPGGSLLIVGHLHSPDATGHGHRPPAEAAVTLADITAGLDRTAWKVVTAEEHARTVTRPGGRAATLHDVVVRAVRRT